MLERNNARVRRADSGQPNPRSVADEAWYRDLVAAHPAIRAEWDAFTADGGDLPLIEDTLGAPDQNQGSYWKMVVLVAQRRPIPPLSAVFPRTTEAMLAVPGLRSACWSVLGPGGWIPEHTGPNAGCLRMLVGVDCGDASLTVSGSEARFADGEATLFDDTEPHAVTNPGDRPRVLLLCDLTRPVPGIAGLRNHGVQRLLHTMTPAYRGSAKRGSSHFATLNPHV
jgi:beta-hydroxylase